MPFPLIAIPAIELALQIIERAIIAGELTVEEVAKRAASASKLNDASLDNVARAINDAEAKQ